MPELKISYTAAGLLMGAYYVSYAALQIPSGYLSEHIKPHKLIAISTLILSISAFSFSLITDFTQGFICRIIIGIGAAFAFVSGMNLIPQWFNQKKLGTPLGIFQSAGGTGATVALVIMPILADLTNWRASLIFVSIPTFAIAAVCWFTLKTKSNNKKYSTIQKIEDKTVKGNRKFFTNSSLWLLGLAMLITIGSLAGISTWIPPFSKEVLNAPPEVIALISGLTIGGVAIGQATSGWISDLLKLRKTIFAAGQFATVICLLTLISLKLDLIQIYVTVLLMGCALGFLSMGFTITTELFPQRRGLALGFVNALGMGGGVMIPPIMGYILDSTRSYFWGFAITSIFLIISAMLMMAVKEKRW
jgi:nitrate/nitrite transporter NarK